MGERGCQNERKRKECEIMNKFGKFVCKYRVAIIIVALLLLIPSAIGMVATRINYDILTYLPDDVATIQGQNILSEQFNMGSFAVLIVDDDMRAKDILSMEDKIKEIECVDKVVGVYDILGTQVPLDSLPDDVKGKISAEGKTPILVTFKTGIAADDTLKAIDDIRDIAKEKCAVAGLSATEDDMKDILNSEMAIYVVVAAVLCIIVLSIALDSYIVPLFLLGSIGIAILYNMGTNIMFGEISYITKAIASVLQLGVTMDFSIFLYHSYIKEKQTSKNIYEAMEKAITSTISSVVGSSITTIAGFLALCTMQLAIGRDIGLVMAKGVLIGLICVVTVLPATILVFDKLIEKTSHKVILPEFTHLIDFVVKHYKAAIIAFLILLVPAIYGNSHVNVYYNINSSLPESLASVPANKALADDFNMVSTQIALVNKDMPDSKVKAMLDEIDSLDGVEWSIAKAKITNGLVPDEMIDDEIKSIFESDKYQMIVINSSYETATNEENELVNKINDVIKKYDEDGILAGEAPLMKDLVEIADQDFNSVNISSIAVIFILMIFVFKSGSIPFILIAVIEFAIFVNMSCTCYANVTIPFVASIVIGTIQLGATVDYAILMTNKYLDARCDGKNKQESAKYALENSAKSIIVSASCFFAATCGVSIISKIDMIGSICTLISRGALISMVVVITMLPAFLMVFDKIICKTTKRTRHADIKY